MKGKAIFYGVLFLLASLVLLSGNLGFLSNQRSIIRPVGLLIFVIMAILIYFDEEYRNKYIPSIPKGFIISAIILSLMIFAYSLV